MRILHLGKYFPPCSGGIETFLHDLSLAQVRNGDSVHCLVHRPPGIHYHPTGGVEVSSALRLATIMYTPLAPTWPAKLSALLRRWQPDVLHCHLPNPTAFYVLGLPAARRLPIVVHWHSDVEFGEQQKMLRFAYGGYRHLERRLLALCDAIIATSPDYARASQPLQPFACKTHIVPLGIEPTRLQEKISSSSPWLAGHLRLLALGRLSHYKGLTHLIEAVRRVPNASLVIAGDGEEASALRQQIMRSGAEQRISLLGACAQPTVNRLLQDCDVVCLTSTARSEAFGMTLLEAMHFTKPVIASDLTGSGMPWLVRRAGHGLLAPPGDHEKLADAIESLSDPKARRSLAENGRKALANEFLIDRIAERLSTIYQALPCK